MELFLEAGNYYQRAYASRYGQMEGLPYPTNALMMSGAGHPMLPPSSMPSVENYYQQILQNGMNGIATPHANLFATPHRPMPLVAPMPGAGFLPLSPPNTLYSTPRLTSTSSPQLKRDSSPEPKRDHSLSPVASSMPSHSPRTSWPAQTTNPNKSDDSESDIEV